jgi:hypothetical protein
MVVANGPMSLNCVLEWTLRVHNAWESHVYLPEQELLSRLVDENEEHYARLAAGIAGLSAATWLCEASAQVMRYSRLHSG